MKALVILLFVLSFYSCKKSDCKQCIRKWTYHSQHTDGSYPKDYDGPTESFEACGSDAIDNAQKTIKTHEVESNIIIDGTAECHCN